MGSIIYDFLADSILFHSTSIENGFKNESDDRLREELRKYRAHCIANYPELIKEITDRQSSLKVFSSSKSTSLDLLKQTALYVDQFVVSDPIFELTREMTEMAAVHAQFLGYQSDRSLNKRALTEAARFLSAITPMVAGNYIKVFPLSYHFEAPKEIPIRIPINYYNDILPQDILSFIRQRALVSSMEKLPEGGWQILEGQLVPSRGIIVDFKGARLATNIYHLFEMEFEPTEEEGKFRYKQWLPDYPPDQDHFTAWVNQSVNSAAKAYFDTVLTENIIASSLDSTYLADNQFTSDLLSFNQKPTEDIKVFTANQVLNLDLPYLDKISIEKLMQVRELEADVFTNFRLELEKQFRELRMIDDPRVIELKTQNILHELGEVQVEKINQKITQVQRQMGLNAAIALGGFLGTIQTGGLSLLGTAIALGKGYKDYLDYQEKVKENPACLLWKVKSKR